MVELKCKCYLGINIDRRGLYGGGGTPRYIPPPKVFVIPEFNEIQVEIVITYGKWIRGQ